MPRSPAVRALQKGYTADTNKDGKTTRAEAKASHISIDAADLNDDGRTTRSEARAAKMAIK